MGRAVAAEGAEVCRHWKTGQTVRIEGDRRILVDRRGSRRDMVNGIFQLFVRLIGRFETGDLEVENINARHTHAKTLGRRSLL